MTIGRPHFAPAGAFGRAQAPFIGPIDSLRVRRRRCGHRTSRVGVAQTRPPKRVIDDVTHGSGDAVPPCLWILRVSLPPCAPSRRSTSKRPRRPDQAPIKSLPVSLSPCETNAEPDNLGSTNERGPAPSAEPRQSGHDDVLRERARPGNAPFADTRERSTTTSDPRRARPCDGRLPSPGEAEHDDLGSTGERGARSGEGLYGTRHDEQRPARRVQCAVREGGRNLEQPDGYSPLLGAAARSGAMLVRASPSARWPNCSMNSEGFMLAAWARRASSTLSLKSSARRRSM